MLKNQSRESFTNIGIQTKNDTYQSLPVIKHIGCKRNRKRLRFFVGYNLLTTINNFFTFVPDFCEKLKKVSANC